MKKKTEIQQLQRSSSNLGGADVAAAEAGVGSGQIQSPSEAIGSLFSASLLGWSSSMDPKNPPMAKGTLWIKGHLDS